jgi:hypothetical protein
MDIHQIFLELVFQIVQLDRYQEITVVVSVLLDIIHNQEIISPLVYNVLLDVQHAHHIHFALIALQGGY